jgi:hypothetical protein
MAISTELKERWLKALPNYSQGKGVLRSVDGGMCCLGVLADITGSWDQHDKYCVDDSPHSPQGPFHGLSPEELDDLSKANDAADDFPYELIRALPTEVPA